MGNVMVTYWPFATANRLGQLKPLLDLLEGGRLGLLANVPPENQTGGLLAGPECRSSYDLLNSPYLNPHGKNSTEPPGYISNLLWALHVAHSQWRVTADLATLRHLFALLRGAVGFSLTLL